MYRFVYQMKRLIMIISNKSFYDNFEKSSFNTETTKSNLKTIFFSYRLQDNLNKSMVLTVTNLENILHAI